MNATCGCCEGTQKLTPESTANRPGLDRLAARAGTHATFLETMLADLSSSDFPELKTLATRDPSDPAIALLDAWATVADVLTFYQERIANEGYLRTATERRSVVELTRLIGYEPQPGVAASAHLAYTLDVDRSFTPPKSIETIVPAGSRAQSVPAPGELPQTFETSEPLEARTEWNNLGVRLTRPQTEKRIKEKRRIYLKGTNTNLKVNDAVLIDFGDPKIGPVPMRVDDVIPDVPADRTEVLLRPWLSVEFAVSVVGQIAASYQATAPEVEGPVLKSITKSVIKLLGKLRKAAEFPLDATKMKDLLPSALETLRATAVTDAELKSWLDAMIERLAQANANLLSSLEENKGLIAPATKADATVLDFALLKAKPSIPPLNATRLEHNPKAVLAANTALTPNLLAALEPAFRDHLYPALRGQVVSTSAAIRFYALRAVAPIFGHNAPPKPLTFDSETGTITDTGEWPLIKAEKKGESRTEYEKAGIIDLEGKFEKISPGSLLVVETAATHLTAPKVQVLRAANSNAALSRSNYGISGNITRIDLAPVVGTNRAIWIDIEGATPHDNDIEALRQTVVFAQSEELELAEEPIKSPIGNCENPPKPDPTKIELDGLYDGLEAGRWLIVSGERTHIPGTSGVFAAELAMLAGVEHRSRSTLPGDKIHTFITLSTALAYCYARKTITIYGNVVKATHGETRREILGGGDSAKSMQTFALRQPPLTFVSARDRSGIRSTLQVRVNDIEWHKTDSLEGLGKADRGFIVRIDDDGKTSIVFGTGERGSRPPTGTENIRADYRNGIGKGGNVQARQISLLSSRPLGVKEVVNPLRASGGADRESLDQARRNAPLGVQALDRVVSVQDYADFARTFAGIGKASASIVNDGTRQLVHLTIAGADDIPIEEYSDLFVNLKGALHDFGDPFVPLKIAERELLALFIAARVRVLPDYEWETVEVEVRAALLDWFSFERRALGQSVTPAEVISVVQRVPGVEYVDLDVLRGISETDAKEAFTEKRGLPSAVAPAPVRAELARRNEKDEEPRILPAQLVFLSPAVPDTLLLTEIPA